jgi:hypothetical protein
VNLLRRPGSVVYGLANLGAFLGGLLVSLILLIGSVNARWTTNHHPGRSASVMLRIYAGADFGAGFLGTVLLFLGLFGVLSSRRIFAIFSLIGAAFLLLVLVPYASDNSQMWSLAFVFCEFVVLILSSIRLTQIRKPR